jgi:hypothetical protein
MHLIATEPAGKSQRATKPNGQMENRMKQVQCKCRSEDAAKRQLVKWLRDENMTDIGLDRTETGFLVYATKVNTKSAAQAVAEA